MGRKITAINEKSVNPMVVLDSVKDEIDNLENITIIGKLKGNNEHLVFSSGTLGEIAIAYFVLHDVVSVHVFGGQ